MVTKMDYILDDKTTIRFARENEVGLILRFIRELAEYEEMLDRVTATEELLLKTIFREKKAEVLFCLHENVHVGFAVFFHNYSTFLGKAGIYLEDLYVKPEMRNLGIGKKLLSVLGKIAAERDCGRIQWWCLDWNKKSIDFYLKLGAQPMDEWTVYRVAGKELVDLANYI